MYFITVASVVFFGSLIILVGIAVNNLYTLSNVRKNQEVINLKASEFLTISNFKLSKKFYLNDNATCDHPDSCKKCIITDNDNEQLCLIDYEKANMMIVKFDEILNYEIYENGSNSTTGVGVNGFAFGAFGAETTGVCKDLKLIIRLNRFDISQVCYEIISKTVFNTGISKSNQTYRDCINTLQEVVSFLEVIKNANIHKEKDTLVN